MRRRVRSALGREHTLGCCPYAVPMAAILRGGIGGETRAMAPSPSAPSRSRRIRSPARRCSRPASTRRGFAPTAMRRPAPRSADARLPRDQCPAHASSCGRSRQSASDKAVASVEVPDLGGVDPVPVRALAARQQIIDRGRGGAFSIRPVRASRNISWKCPPSGCGLSPSSLITSAAERFMLPRV